VTNPTRRRICAMMVEQRRPFGSVWIGAEELIHVVRDAFVTIPALDPGATVTLRFKAEGAEGPIVRQPSNKGLVVLDARHDHASGETRLRVSVCREQPLSVEGIDPERVYRVQIGDEAAHNVAPRTVRTIQSLLGRATGAGAAAGLRARTPGTQRFLDLMIAGDENRFVERTIRIQALPADASKAAKLRILAATPARTGRVV